MVETSGTALIRGIDVDKAAKGFADEAVIFKNWVRKSKTSAREIRWYQKTAGYLDTPDTTGITASQIKNMAPGALPFVTEQSWTRQTSYVQKYMVSSPLITIEDIKDSDIDVLGGNIRDIVIGVGSQVDQRIYNVITENQTPVNINTAAALGTGWDDATNGKPIKDILLAKKGLRQQRYNPEGAILAMDSTANTDLINYLIDTKGSSIPGFSSEKVRTGVVLEILGVNVVVSENVVTDSVAMWIPNISATWKSFMPMQSVVIDDPGIGKTIRAWEEGECLLTDPKSVYLITDTTT